MIKKEKFYKLDKSYFSVATDVYIQHENNVHIDPNF